MIRVGRRIHEHLVYINDEPCMKTKARKATTCVHSRKPITPGDWVYRPFGNSSIRSARWLASEVETAETSRMRGHWLVTPREGRNRIFKVADALAAFLKAHPHSIVTWIET